MKKVLLVSSIVLSLAACATNPDKIASVYVPPSEYDGKSCVRLLQEQHKVDVLLGQAYKSMKSESNANIAFGVIGAVVFWPSLLLMKGKDATADAEFAELKGRKTAIEKTITKRGC